MSQDKPDSSIPEIERGTYEIILQRLRGYGNELKKRLDALNEARKEVFGSIETKLLATERVSTINNCLARDIISLGNNRFLFGYNVFMGLKTETSISDVFSFYQYHPDEHVFSSEEAPFLHHEQFEVDFKNLYKYYRDTQFVKFAEIGPHIFMVFQVGASPDDVKTFKWLKSNGEAAYIDNRSDHEYRFPPQHEFEWKKVNREMHRRGKHPHISIEDRIFVETVGGDLTIKVENNTESGKGIYQEPVEDKDQTLDDAEIFYAELGNLIALKIRPYKEEDFRYFIFNEKVGEVKRVDAMSNSCVLLPDNQGLIFAQGYYIQTGDFKLFQSKLSNMLFEKRIAAPNGEDFLYVFYGPENGTYILLTYNIIIQEVATPKICNGFSFFENGELILFKAEEEQKKHHAIQIWQTPFHSPNQVVSEQNEDYLFKIGNKEIVVAMAEMNELLKLIEKKDTYANLYIDLSKISRDILDSYHWLDKSEAQNLADPVSGIKDTAITAISEYEKVVQIRKNSQQALDSFQEEAEKVLSRASRTAPKSIYEYVNLLSELRSFRGRAIGLRDLRYINEEKLISLENDLAKAVEKVSLSCVHFLVNEKSLEPYHQKVDELNSKVEQIDKVVEADKLDSQILNVSKELEMLIEIVGNLKITDATQTTKIIENISSVYARFNQIKSALSKRKKTLALAEGVSEFNAQLKLIQQSLSNYLDISDTPEKCDQNLNKLMIQLEDLEGKFIDYDQFIGKVAEKREEIYSLFETRRISLLEERNKRSLTLSESAKRITDGIRTRLLNMSSEDEINSYFASDVMVEKVREITAALIKMGDSVRADAVESGLKTAYQDAVRQNRDKKDLFLNGSDVIRLGEFNFNVNTQNSDLSIVKKEDGFYFHIVSTEFFEKIQSIELMELEPVWDQTLISENDEIYRAEYLAFNLYKESLNTHKENEIKPLIALNESSNKELLEYVRSRMLKRHNEGYSKGVHDFDAALLLNALITFHINIGVLRFPPEIRVAGLLSWNIIQKTDKGSYWTSQLSHASRVRDIFPGSGAFSSLIAELALSLKETLSESIWVHIDFQIAAEFIFEITTGDEIIRYSEEAHEISTSFTSFLKKQKATQQFESSLKEVEKDVEAQFILTYRWLKSFSDQGNKNYEFGLLLEASWEVLQRGTKKVQEHRHKLSTVINGFRGDHPVLTAENYVLQFNKFIGRLSHFEKNVIPKFERFTSLRRSWIESKRKDIRLSEFKPNVLSSFVRNRLLDEVYLPLIGENLAKQIGVAGESKRTDLMGLLLLISPPGYGKTTLMEYVANRLGLLFMKINGPSLGHDITSVDPSVASNSGAREELEKLNLAFEMGDNVMIYIDDIQHCSPEFLQKFISLCDAQRKIDGVYKGEGKTYDFKGRKVAVVMAGNPYTESGERFQIPDMLANRADTYNLGDIIGGKYETFALSYIENSITSNSVVSTLNNKSRKDLHALISVAQSSSTEPLELESKLGAEEVEDMLRIFRKMITVRDVVLAVNREYIRSASQADEFREEPPFRLQGSYRNMNKLVSKLSPLMNDEELETVIVSHYESESQTLTKGAEFNLLRFKELIGILNEEEQVRLEAIRTIFKKNQKIRGFGSNNNALLLEQVQTIADGLFSISKALEKRDRNEIN